MSGLTSSGFNPGISEPMTQVPRSLGAHDGSFHADEVTACALLLFCKLIDRDKIIRTRDPARLAECDFVCDVGGYYDPSKRLFDHHQVDYVGPLSSAGMILKYLRDEGKLTQDEYDHFNDSLVIGVDDHDNGRAPVIPGHCSFSHIVSNFMPIRHDCSEEERTAAFLEAVDFVLSHLHRSHQRHCYTRSCRDMVADCMKRYRDCLVFDESIPWLESFFMLGGEQHPARFIIMPSGEHWKLRSIPPTYKQRMGCRLPLPIEWAGLLEKDLERVTGIPGSIFCHKGRFISVWETKEAALQALEYILNQSELTHENSI